MPVQSLQPLVVGFDLARREPRVSDELELVRRAQRGEAEALDTLARRELPRVEGLLGRILGPRRDLEDLVQNVFVELLRALPKFRGDSKLSTFVGGITVQVARRALRPSAWDRRKLPLGDLDPALDASSVDEVAHRRAQLGALHRALAELSDDHRISLVLWALEGMEPAAIAEVMGASVSATRSRIWWAQKHLRRAAERDPLLRELIEEEP